MILSVRDLKEHLVLARIGTAGLTVTAPICGALAAFGITGLSTSEGAYLIGSGSTLNGGQVLHILSLLIVGLLMHIMGFVFNDYADVEVDRRSSSLKTKPLVRGTIPDQHALVTAIGSGTACLIIGSFVAGLSLFATLILAMSIALGIAYDIFGKIMAGSDLLLAGWAGAFALYGAASVVPTDLSILRHPFIWSMAALGTTQVLFSNAIEGGLKDIETDLRARVRTMAIALGVTHKERLRITCRFKLFACSVKTAHVAMIAISFSFLYHTTPATQHGLFGIVVAALAIITVMMFGTMILILSPWTWQMLDRRQILGIFIIHEIATYEAVPVLLVPLVGVPTSIVLILFPIIWGSTFNWILYGGLVPTNV